MTLVNLTPHVKRVRLNRQKLYRAIGGKSRAGRSGSERRAMLKVIAHYDGSTAYGQAIPQDAPAPHGWELVGFASGPEEAKSFFEGHVREMATDHDWPPFDGWLWDDEETNDGAASGCTTCCGPERGEKRR